MPDFEISTLDEPEPWDRQLTETSEEYLAFATYRNLGPKRTYAEVARELSLSAGRVSAMATDHEWSDRVAAWDFYQERIYQAELAEHTRQMARRHVEITSQALEILRQPINAMLRRMERDPEGFADEFSAADLTKLMKMVQESAKIMPNVMNAERLAVGQPTDITETHQNLHYGDTERLGEVLDVLRSTGVLPALLGEGTPGQITDAEVIEVDDDYADAEADSLPPGTSS